MGAAVSARLRRLPEQELHQPSKQYTQKGVQLSQLHQPSNHYTQKGVQLSQLHQPSNNTSPMKWIVITSPDFVSGEALFIDRLFGHGLDLLHLRKPGSTIESCRELLRQIPERWHSRIVLHDHFSLTGEFHLHGVHLNRRCPHAPDGYMGSISCSCHSLEEVAKKKPTSDYVFLSPIFNSISKAGYEAAFSTAALQHAAEEGIIDAKVYALGGVSKEHIAQLKELSFGGAAFLGDVWRRMYDPTVDVYLDELRSLLG